MINPDNFRKYNEYISLGAEIAGSMVVPLLIGSYVDDHFHTQPWGIVIGIIGGFLGVSITLYKITVQSKNKRDDNDREK